MAPVLDFGGVIDIERSAAGLKTLKIGFDTVSVAAVDVVAVAAAVVVVAAAVVAAAVVAAAVVAVVDAEAAGSAVEMIAGAVLVIANH
ncbi:unnamed protein product [Saccharomyces cerevisiae]|nr:unnamed protein product [Saccharomyces cerevisiae]